MQPQRVRAGGDASATEAGMGRRGWTSKCRFQEGGLAGDSPHEHTRRQQPMLPIAAGCGLRRGSSFALAPLGAARCGQMWPATEAAEQYGRLARSLGGELLGELDDQSFRTADIAEPIGVLVLPDLADRVKAFVSQPIHDRVDVIDLE